MVDERPGSQFVFMMPLAPTREADTRAGSDEDDAFEEELELPEQTRAPSVRWAPSDCASPYYSHLLADGQSSVSTPRQFELSSNELELLIKLNDYFLTGYKDLNAFCISVAESVP